MSSNMQEAFVNLNGVPTHVITWGRWIEESLENIDEIVICITGNPGLPGFYTEFLGTLYEKLQRKMPVWVIGHAGHDDPPNTSIRRVPCLEGNERLFDLDGQILHKIELIQKYLPKNTKIHLIGHSIGAWMILELLQHASIKERIKKCYMLFPTVERMVESPNGWIFTKIALPLFYILGFFITIFNHLPVLIQVLLVQLYFWLFSIPRTFISTALGYTKKSVVEKVVFLAKDEMCRVQKLNRNAIRANISLIKLYYGTTDGWVPIKYYKELCQEFPGIDAQLDTKKIDHAFVLRYSDSMATIVGDMIKNHSNLLSQSL